MTKNSVTQGKDSREQLSPQLCASFHEKINVSPKMQTCRRPVCPLISLPRPDKPSPPPPEPPDFNRNTTMLQPGFEVLGKDPGFQTQTLKWDREALREPPERQETWREKRKLGDHKLLRRRFCLPGVTDVKILQMNEGEQHADVCFHRLRWRQLRPFSLRGTDRRTCLGFD